MKKGTSEKIFTYSLLFTLVLLTFASRTHGSTCNTSTQVCVNVTLKLQGILSKPTKLNDQVTIVSKVVGNPLTTPIPEIYTMSASDNNAGIWNGEIQFDEVFEGSATSSSNKFKLLIKPPKHLARVVCEKNPIESKPYDYKCASAEGSITLKKGTNDLNFERIYFLAGDIPINDKKQNGVIDSSDLIYIRGKIGSKKEKDLKIADLNMDDIIDTQDFSLAIFSLSVANTDQDFQSED